MVTSHAKIICSVRGWGKPIHWDCLLVDEAHTLADVAASLLSSSLSFLGWKRVIGKEKNWKKVRLGRAIEAAGKAMDVVFSLIKLVPEGEVSPLTLRAWTPYIAAALEKIDAVLDKASTTNISDEIAEKIKALKVIKGSMKSISCVATGDSKDSVRIKKSKVMRYPSIDIGPRSIYGLMQALWKRTPAAVLFSATMYLRLKTGEWTCKHIARTDLHVPQNRLMEFKPYAASWLYTTPVVLMPAEAIKHELKYLYSDDPSCTKMAAWHDAASKSIAYAAQSAAGGTLVLSPSFRDVEAFAIRLKSLLPGRKIVWQSEKENARSIKDKFFASAKQGERPVWLGTGPAWTGLDLSDKSVAPENDYILTDLIIPRIPFGMRNDVRSHVRRQYMGIAPDCYDAFFTIRQGLGRLVRRKGLQKRRIWWLDTRISRGGIYMLFAQLLRLYSQSEFSHAAIDTQR